MAWNRPVRVGAFVLGLLCMPARALADDAVDPDALFKSALKDLNDGKLDRACPALRESYRLDPRPVVLFYSAECEERAGRVGTAAAAYDDYLAAFDKLSPGEQRDEAAREQQATKRREELQPKIPRITLTLPGDAPEGTRLSRATREGVWVPLTLNAPLPIDPGEHVIRVQAPGRPDWDHRIFIFAGDQKKIEVPVPPPDKNSERGARVGKPLEPVPSYLPPLESGSNGQRIAAYVSAGIGAASLIAGVVTGALTWAEKGPVETNCANNFCNPTGEEAAARAQGLGLASTVTFIVGGIGLATGIVLYVTAPPPAKLSAAPSRVAIRPGGVEAQWQW